MSTATDNLSPQQRRVAELLAEGLREQEIADRLGLAKSTVKAHKQIVYLKLDARNAVDVARALGVSQ
jgi:two-component system response regulator TtrR